MSRRHEGPGFGSDSFLDVIANVVGILIILIVVAGIRVSRAPVPTEPLPEPTEIVEAPPVTEPVAPPVMQPVAEVVAVEPAEPTPIADASPLPADVAAAVLAASEPPDPTTKSKRPEQPPWPPAIAEPRPQRIVAPSAALLSAISAADTETENLRRAVAALGEQLAGLRTREARLREQVERAQGELLSLEAQADGGRRRLAELERQAERLEVEFVGRQRELAEAERQTGPVEPLKHRYTPVSRTITGKELHFHLRGGRIAVVPLDELVERMKSQLERQKGWLAKVRQHEGRVGAVRGFRLDYIVAREEPSILEAARLGGGIVRIVPVLLKFVPEDNLPAETAAQALSAGSLFIRELMLAEPDTALTFWVYPDSYGLYRELKGFAHAEGFTVAARPLREGDEITASPWGSKSAGQ